MKIKVNTFRNRFLVVIIIGVISYPVVTLIRGYDLFETSVYYLLGFSGYTMLSLFLIMESQNLKSRFFQKKYSWSDHFSKRLIIEIFATFFLTAISVNLVYPIFLMTFFYGMGMSVPAWWFYNIMALLLSFLFLFFVNIGFFIEEWQNSLVKNEVLEKEGIRAKLEALQSQISPHFLFNNFNILNALIDIDPKLAQQYLVKLSDVFRYILKNHQDEMVRLKEELSFIEDFLFLMRIRFSENLKVEFSIDSEKLNHNLPPATLQLLVENAVKHNEVSKRNPLSIKIYTSENDTLTVENNLQPKQSIEPGNNTGMGLTNIKERYHYLTSDLVEIKKTENLFTVRIPLIEIEKDEYTDR